MSCLKGSNINKKTPFVLVFWTALLVGTLDICAALLNSYLRSETSPLTVLRFIASGILGNKAFGYGIFSAILGLIFHYFIAFIWAFIFFVTYPKIKINNQHKFLAELAYGIIIWLIMNLIVVPLSNTPPFTQHFFLSKY